jgi:hypothetical protein
VGINPVSKGFVKLDPVMEMSSDVEPGDIDDKELAGSNCVVEMLNGIGVGEMENEGICKLDCVVELFAKEGPARIGGIGVADRAVGVINVTFALVVKARIEVATVLVLTTTVELPTVETKTSTVTLSQTVVVLVL